MVATYVEAKRFVLPKTDEEIKKAHIESIPKKTRSLLREAVGKMG